MLYVSIVFIICKIKYYSGTFWMILNLLFSTIQINSFVNKNLEILKILSVYNNFSRKM